MNCFIVNEDHRDAPPSWRLYLEDSRSVGVEGGDPNMRPQSKRMLRRRAIRRCDYCIWRMPSRTTYSWSWMH